jgi:Immunity protein 53
MPRDVLSELAQWYSRHCDGAWERQQGITIATTDNRGWWVKIDLAGTELAVRGFAPVREGLTTGGIPAEQRWLWCRLQDSIWYGAGDDSRLAEIIGHFLGWAVDRDDIEETTDDAPRLAGDDSPPPE